MASLMPTTQAHHSRISSALAGQGVLATQVIAALNWPIKSPDYQPIRLEVHFNSSLVLLQESGRLVYQHAGFAPGYRPKILSIYGDSELLFVKAKDEILLNRLPQQFLQEWKHYVA